MIKNKIDNSEYIMARRINPLLKWPGGKSGELNIILSKLPANIERYYEPFLGGGAVFFSISETIPSILNDKSVDLIEFYRNVSCANVDFFYMLEKMHSHWLLLEEFIYGHEHQLIELYFVYSKTLISKSELRVLISNFIDSFKYELSNIFSSEYYVELDNLYNEFKKNLVSKIERMKNIEEQKSELSNIDIINNLEGALKSSFYMHLRYLYNYPNICQIQMSQRSAIYFFIREYAYAAMFRFNQNGKFNVPYGGIGYNKKDLSKKISNLQSREVRTKLQSAIIECMDFIDFLEKYPPKQNDFIFLDPPYDSDFSNYDKNNFDLEDQKRLASFLVKQTVANFMLVIKATDFIYSLYSDKGLNILSFDKKYSWTIKDRNDRDTTHLMITNY